MVSLMSLYIKRTSAEQDYHNAPAQSMALPVARYSGDYSYYNRICNKIVHRDWFFAHLFVT